MEEMGIYLDAIRFLTGTIILFYASYTDIKTRRASNYLWFIMSITGAVILLIQYLTIGFGQYIMYLIFIPIMIGMMYLFFQLRLIFGGADAKALMSIAILAPLQPEILEFPLLKGSPMPFSWSIFSNSVLIFLVIPISLLILNLIRRNIEFPYLFIGYKMDVEKALKKFVWPLDRIIDGKRKFTYMPSEFDAEEEIIALQNFGLKNIWVTPKIPFMIPLLAGFICAFIFGDMLYILMNLLF